MLDIRSDEEVVVPFAAEGVRVWDLRNGQLRRTYRAPPRKTNGPIEAAASRDGRWLVLGWASADAHVWDARKDESPTELNLNPVGAKGPLRSSHRVAVSPDSRYLAIATMTAVVVYDLPAGRVVHTLPHPAPKDQGPWPSALAFTHDSASMVMGWRPYQGGAPVTRYDLRTGERTALFYPHKHFVHAVVCFQDGRLLTASQTGEVKLWDRDQKELRSFVGHRGAVNGAAVSPDERRLVTAGDDGTVRLWDVETGLELLTLGKHDKGGMGVRFSPDGTRVASTGSDGTLRVWSVAPPPAPVLGPAPRVVAR
jgi:WD40 repeat protein